MLSEIATLFALNPLYFAGSAFVLGLVIGSFLNVVIYRLPIMLDREWRAQAAEVLATPLPAQAPIKAWQNIPLVSWLALRGRCAACATRISVRYPLVELTTGVLSLIVAWHFGFGASALCALLVTWTLIALTGIDIDHQLLPDSLTLTLMWAGLLAAIFVGPAQGVALPVSPQDAIIGAGAGYLSLWLVYHLFKLVTGKEGMGYGDFKLFAALGAWLGWKLLPLIILLSAATGAVLGILMILLRGRDRAAPMPFGPYLAAAGWLAMMYGDALVSGYLRVSGLRH
jgi:leader peptidase (prepilin peptidase)/N-methyltransferase